MSEQSVLRENVAAVGLIGGGLLLLGVTLIPFGQCPPRQYGGVCIVVPAALSALGALVAIVGGVLMVGGIWMIKGGSYYDMLPCDRFPVDVGRLERTVLPQKDRTALGPKAPGKGSIFGIFCADSLNIVPLT